MLIKTQVQPTKGSKQLSACIAAISRKFTCLSQQLCACNFSQTKGLQTPWANLKQSFIFLMLWHEHFLNRIKHSEQKTKKKKQKAEKQSHQIKKKNTATDFLLKNFQKTFLTPKNKQEIKKIKNYYKNNLKYKRFFKTKKKNG